MRCTHQCVENNTASASASSDK